MQIKIWAFAIFYRRIFIPAFLISTLYILVLGGSGFIFFFLTPIAHFVVYEHFYKQEYFFYYHIGLSKKSLWSASIVCNGCISILLLLL